MSINDIFTTVITIAYEDGNAESYGIKGPLTIEQDKVISAANLKYADDDNVLHTKILMGIDNIEDAELEEKEEEKLKAITIPWDRVILLDTENWPVYPVRVFTFYIWC